MHGRYFDSRARPWSSFGPPPTRWLRLASHRSGVNRSGVKPARNALRRLARLWNAADANAGRSQLTGLVSALASDCRDPGLLRDIAGLLTDALTEEAPAQAKLLRVLADLDQAADAQAFLARTDPDLALWLRRIRDLPEPAPKPRRRKTRAG